MFIIGEYVNQAIPIVTNIAARDKRRAPALNTLARVSALLRAGGRTGVLEADAAMRAMQDAAVSEAISPEEKQTLVGLLKKVLSALGGSGYGEAATKEAKKPDNMTPEEEEEWKKKYPDVAKESVANPIDISTEMSPVAESDGLEWNVRLIKSGKTVDKRQVYTREAVRNSVGLFENAQCFADHNAPGTTPSVDKLIGWFTNPKIVELEDGEVAIDATLHVLASTAYASMLREIATREAKNTVGLSINGDGIVHQEADRDGSQIIVIESISKIHSTDLVTKPNAGGELISMRASIFASAGMLPEVNLQLLETKVIPPHDDKRTPPKTETNKELESLKAEVASMKADAVRASINAAVQASKLPDTIIRSIQPQIDRCTSLAEANSLIDSTRTVWAIANESVSSALGVKIEVTDNPTRHLLRLQGLVAGQPIEGVEPYFSLHEAFSDITGRPMRRIIPQELATAIIQGAWGYDSSRRSYLQASIDASDWPYALGQAIYREVIRDYKLPMFDEWRKIVSNFGDLKDMRSVTRLRTGFFDVLPVVAAGGTYQPMSDTTEDKVQYAPSKRGGLADFTWEMALNDDLNELRKIPKKLALSAKVTLWYDVFDIFANATPPTMDYDSIALFHATHNNLGGTTLSTTTWSAGRKAMMTQSVLDSSKIMIGAVPKFCLIPPDLDETARKLRDSDVDPSQSVSGVNVANPWKGTFEIIIIPFWTDADAWAAVADPSLVPTIEVGFLGGKEEPEIATEAVNSGSNFSADRVTYRVRFVYGIKCLDHRGMYKAVP